MNCSKASIRRGMLLLLLAGGLARPLSAEEKRTAPPVEKTARAKPAADSDWQGITQKTPSKLRYFMPTGFSFPARLENAIYSYNAETPAIGIVERGIKYLDRVVIPAETRIIGAVSVQKSHDRVLVNWHTMVFPEGDEIKFSGIALSVDGSAGLKGKVETHKDSAVANTVLRSVVSGTQAALDITGISPIASQATQGVSQEALKELDLEKQQVTTSISIDSDVGLRVFINQRVEY